MKEKEEARLKEECKRAREEKKSRKRSVNVKRKPIRNERESKNMNTMVKKGVTSTSKSEFEPVHNVTHTINT